MGKIKRFNISENYNYYISDKNDKSKKVSKSDFIKAGVYNGMKSKNFKIDSDKKQVVAKFESFNSTKTWLVYYSAGNGLGEEYEKFEGTEKQASDYCYQMACESYDSYAGIHGIRDIDEIMEEDGVDEDDAEQTYNDDRESSIDYRYEIYDDIKHSDYIKESVESLSKNPKVKTTLIGVDGNAFSLMGHFSSKAREQGWNRADINEVTNMAMEGDYNHLIRTLMTYIDDTYEDNDDDDDDTYKLFESVSDNQFFKTKEETKDWLDDMDIDNYTINDDLTIDVDGDVNLNNKKLEKIPVKFKSIGGHFDCYNNKLTSLKGSPSSVGGYFDCGNNQLTSLKGSPSSVGGYFDCRYNRLTSLEGSPDSVGGYFDCGNNQLTSLEGSPDSVGGNFYCSNNRLTSLKGSPESVGGDFNCHNNQLTSLEGSPDSVVGHFDCSNNQLTSLEGSPDSVVGHFDCSNNPIEEIYNLFDNKECIKWLNEYNVIKGNKIDLEGFKDVIYMMDVKDTFNYEKLYKLKNYKVV